MVFSECEFHIACWSGLTAHEVAASVRLKGEGVFTYGVEFLAIAAEGNLYSFGGTKGRKAEFDGGDGVELFEVDGDGFRKLLCIIGGKTVIGVTLP